MQGFLQHSTVGSAADGHDDLNISCDCMFHSCHGSSSLLSAAMQDVSDAEAAVPAVIREAPLLTLWYRPDKGFCTPKAVVCAFRPCQFLLVMLSPS